MKINQYIKEYLDYYCNIKNDTPFAILLKGKWGCGKTYFIRNYIENVESKRFVHISLYGVDSFNAIKEKIIIELIPLIPRDHKEKTGSIFKSIRSVPVIKKWITPDVDELIVNLFLEKNKEIILVFDDLERCSIEIDRLLGYLNYFIEFKSQKVILIANEEEILKSENADIYRANKEKLIGKEFVINADQEKAIEILVKKIQNSDLQKRSKNIRAILLEIFLQSKYDNLRLMQQALSHFEYFFKSFSSKAKESDELFEKMFYEFVVIFIEHKKGVIKNESFSAEYPQFFKNFGEDEETKHFLNKYRANISHSTTCFNIGILGKILQGIDLSKEEKDELISNLENLAEVNKESWQKLWYCYEKSDDEFFENLRDVHEKWNEKEYDDLLIILHIFGMFLDFSKKNLMKKNKKIILMEGKDYIEKLIEDNKFPLNIIEQNDGFSWRDSSYGLGYSGMDNKEWTFLIEFINNKLNALRHEYIKQKITNELMPILRYDQKIGDLSLFMNYNFLHHNGKRESYFQYLDASEIARILLESDRGFLGTLRKVFKYRYENMANEITNIKLEQSFLKELKEKLEDEIKRIEEKYNNRKTPRSILLQSFIDTALQPFIKNKKDLPNKSMK